MVIFDALLIKGFKPLFARQTCATSVLPCFLEGGSLLLLKRIQCFPLILSNSDIKCQLPRREVSELLQLRLPF